MGGRSGSRCDLLVVIYLLLVALENCHTMSRGRGLSEAELLKYLEDMSPIQSGDEVSDSEESQDEIESDEEFDPQENVLSNDSDESASSELDDTLTASQGACRTESVTARK